MKWSEMSAFHRFLYVLTLVCFAACLVFSVLSFVKDSPLVYTSASRAMVSIAFLCMSIINWQKLRKAAVIHLVCAALMFVAALIGFLG